MYRYGLGIDAGGTYTDAVIYNRQELKVESKGKALSTPWDFTEGIRNVLGDLAPELLAQVGLVSLSTTLATNAIVEDRGQPVGLLVMPGIGGFDARDILYEPKALISGKISITGELVQPIDTGEVRRVAGRMIQTHGVRAFAVSGYAGCINPAHEIRIKQILMDDFGLPVTCGHELSDILDFRTRARTAVLNARIIPLLTRLLADLQQVLRDQGLQVPTVVVKGDGTLMSGRMAAMRPVETILSGPAASVAGALHLTGLRDALVVDMGGTTTDTAFISRGVAAVCHTGAVVKGVKTHVKAIQMRTEGIGGDSFIQWEAADVAIGPRRVLPVAWLAAHAPRTEAAIDFLTRHRSRYKTSARHMQILWRTGPSDGVDSPTPAEKEVLSLLQKRPHALDEIAERTGVPTADLLRIERLEDEALVQRCGFTPTDVLHIQNRFTRWDRDAALRIGRLYAELSGVDLPSLGEKILARVTDMLIIELLKKVLDEETEPDNLLQNSICRTLIDNMLHGGNRHYAVQITLHRPVVGIGAPIHFFLPGAAKRLGTRAVLPEHAAVANAVGAITSQVVVRRKLEIISDQPDRYKLLGVSDIQRFDNLADADEIAGRILRRQVLELARAAGTSAEKIDFWREDRSATAAGGRKIFLGRTVFAQLSGEPDLVYREQLAQAN